MTDQIEIPQCFVRLAEAAKGLSHGSDWNNGTHAKLHGYRQKLLAALSECDALLREAAQPAASVEPVAAVVREHDGRAFAVLRPAGESLPDGTELYAAPVAAQTADELAECRSAVADEVLALLERSLAVIQHDIDEIGGCDHSVGICCCGLIHLADDIRAAIAAAMRKEGKQ